MSTPGTILNGHQATAIVGAAGALTVILVWVAGLAELVVPPEVGSAFTTIVATLTLFGIGRGRKAPP